MRSDEKHRLFPLPDRNERDFPPDKRPSDNAPHKKRIFIAKPVKLLHHLTVSYRIFPHKAPKKFFFTVYEKTGLYYEKPIDGNIAV
jgi:hypothetical protein